MINPILITLSENDKRVIFALLIVVILVIAFVGLLGYLLVRLMKWQAKKGDTLIHDVVVTKVITDRKHLISYGRKKNWALFYKQAIIPIIILLVSGAFLLIWDIVRNDFSYNPFSIDNGFGSLFFTWKPSGELTGDEFTIIRFNKLIVDNTPHFVWEGWAGYIIAPGLIVGGIWYYIVCSAFVARTIQIQKRSREVFEKSLEGFTQAETPIVEKPEKTE